MALSILTQYSNDFDKIKKTIYDFNLTSSNKILFRLSDDNRLIIFNDFVKTPTKDTLFNNSRSIVLALNEDKYKIVAFTHPVVDYNNNVKISEFADKKFAECYEGTLISVYYCNEKWNYSTRRCLDAKKSFWAYNGKVSDTSHFDMFVESLVTPLADFEASLDKTQSYYFVAVHHKNKTYIDYTEKFGALYKKNFLLFVRDGSMNETSEYNEALKPYVDTQPLLSNEEIIAKIETEKTVMGYLLNDGGQFYVYHTKYYQEYERAAPFAYSYENMLIELFKSDNLAEHFKLFPENVKYRETSFDTKGVMCSLFTYTSITLLNLYYHFTLFTDGKLSHRNPEDFTKLFTEKNYTLQGLLYKMKGLVIKNKRKLELADVKQMLKYYINSQDLFRCLKELEEFKKEDMALFKRMNPKYNDGVILGEFLKNL